MKANAGKRKIFDAVDLLTEDTSAQTTEVKAENGVEQIKIDEIQAFHDHPFHLYEGERLQDMVQSIKEHGVLNPVIVRKLGKGYEMLSGHNRVNAAKLAGLTEVPAIVKADLPDEEAYMYVIETNLMQRSFNDLMPSEKAVIMAAHYDKVCCQGKRNDIIRELKILNGEEPDDTCCHNGNKLKSLDVIASEYGFSSRNAARYLRLNYLIQPFKNMIKYQFIDMKEKGMSKGEFTSVAQANGGMENMINWEGKDQDTLALIKYIADEDKLEKILENPQVIKTPVVRNGKQSTLGYQPEVWKGWN